MNHDSIVRIKKKINLLFLVSLRRYKKLDTRLRRFIVIGAVIVVGVAVLFLAKAAIASLGLEVEKGSMNGATTLSSTSASGSSFVRFGRTNTGTNYTWKPIKVGGGGYITGISISKDGKYRYAKTDTYGSFKWVGPDDASGHWEQIITKSSWPNALATYPDGAWDIAAAPSNGQKVYMVHNNYLLHSENSGASWTNSNVALKNAGGCIIVCNSDGALDTRNYGPYITVDPADQNVAYVSTISDGVLKTVDGGANWTKIAAIPSTPSNLATGLMINPSNSSQVIVPVNGMGVYISNDSGANWVMSNGAPSGKFGRSDIANDGTFVTAMANDHTAWKFKNGSWTKLTLPHSDNVQIAAINPNNSQDFIIAEMSGRLERTTDGGINWVSGWGYPQSKFVNDGYDVGWLAGDSSWMTLGQIKYDPVLGTSKVWATNGVGVQYFDLGVGINPYTTYHLQTRGIEQMVSTRILSIPGGKTFYSFWDQGIFDITNPDVLPTNHYPFNKFTYVFDIDYSYKDRNYVVNNGGDGRQGCGGHFDLSDAGFSTNGGTSWSRFLNNGPDPNAENWCLGNMAVSDPGNIVWASATTSTGNHKPKYTKDGGNTWADINSSMSINGLVGAYWQSGRQILVSDKAIGGVFYIANSDDGIYKSTDGGANWTLVNSTLKGGSYSGQGQLKAVPGKAGNLFISQGGYPGNMLRSTDGGTTWSQIAGMSNVDAYGFGKEAPNSTYPAIYVIGTYNGVHGVFRSIDNASSWQKIGDSPMGSMDDVDVVSGDMNVFGRVYVGFRGSSGVYGSPQ